MRKTALILAGAIAFDLGVLVVAGQAATAPAPASGACLKVKLTDCMVTSIAPGAPVKNAPTEQISLNFAKFDAVNTPQSCVTNGDKVTNQNGVPGCLHIRKSGGKPPVEY